MCCFFTVQANNLHGVVIAERTDMSKQYFRDLQKFCVSDLGLDLIPVANQSEGAAFLIQMVSVISGSICFRMSKDFHHFKLLLFKF